MKRTDKPWGYELFWAENSLYYGKTLMIIGGKSLPRQRHQVKDKTLRVQRGTLVLEVKNSSGKIESFNLDTGESCRIEAGIEHKISAITDAEVVEVSTPDNDNVIIELM
jgi:mannose-6-phosphate isomerase-like protein (cupin superfamily)